MIGAAEIVRAFCAYINKTFVLDRCGGEGGGHDGEGDEEEEAGLHGGGELVREGAQKIELDFYGGEAPLLYAAEGDFFLHLEKYCLSNTSICLDLENII